MHLTALQLDVKRVEGYGRNANEHLTAFRLRDSDVLQTRVLLIV